MWTTWANTDAVGQVKHDGRAVWHPTIVSRKPEDIPGGSFSRGMYLLCLTFNRV